jgi:membrane protein YdbS with pleckstrin-like domain
LSLSLLQNSASSARTARKDNEAGHHLRVVAAASAAIMLVGAIAAYGASYYLLPLDERPYSDKYEMLRPSGLIGINLGILGTILFFIIFLYALRKVIPWLGRIGTARHWMDFHVIAGITAPILIAFHASFKFSGIAGVAFWIMVAVALSGIIGRYLYAQIPRSISAAELSLDELQRDEDALAEALRGQSLYTADQINRVLSIPSAAHIRRIGPLLAIGEMIALDVQRPFHVAALRRASSGISGVLRSAGGLLSSGNSDVEYVIKLIRQKAKLSKRVVFLDQTQRVFHLWHVVHRPFSYAFAVLAVIHIAVVMSLGFITVGFH